MKPALFELFGSAALDMAQFVLGITTTSGCSGTTMMFLFAIPVIEDFAIYLMPLIAAYLVTLESE